VDEDDDADIDGDGFTTEDGDCNDNHGWIQPGMAEMCDGLDNNCDGVVDEGCDESLSQGPVALPDSADGCSCESSVAGRASAPSAWLALLLVLVAGSRRRRLGRFSSPNGARRKLLAVGLVAALGLFSTACGSDVTVAAARSSLVISPGMVDLGDVTVGESHEIELHLDLNGSATVQLVGVDVLNVAGAFFSMVENEVDSISPGETQVVALNYEPDEAGFHWAIITFHSTATESTVEVHVRAHAVAPHAWITPVLDFGDVAIGGDATLQAELENRGLVSITFQAGATDHTDFVALDPFPFTLDAGEGRSLDVLFAPSEEGPVNGSLGLVLSGGLSLPVVILRGNDCLHGEPVLYDTDGDGYGSCGGDCDNLASTTHPGAQELQDGVDNDCDGIVDEGTDAYDDDGDGYTELDGDCNDADPAVNPGATEDQTNGYDDDCDGSVDPGTTDLDGDGYGVLGGDCDDSDATVYPGAEELPDGVDNDCDAQIDEGTTDFDDDGDGMTESGGDCNDADVDTYWGAVELAYWIDNDCDGLIDEGTIYSDDDGDGFTDQGGDCDDTDSSVHPGQAEVIGNSIDDNCDGVSQ